MYDIGFEILRGMVHLIAECLLLIAEKKKTVNLIYNAFTWYQ